MEFESLPDHPGELVHRWLSDARERSGQPNWNVMMLATVDAEQRPSVRAVLLKDHDPASCTFTFFTNYRSRKARDMEGNPSVAAAMYWDALDRQVRIEGGVHKVPADMSDAYFATRPRASQIGAWASEQSQPLASYDVLLRRVEEVSTQYEGRPVPRPPHWGGYCITASAIELWHSGPGRVHERVRYVRASGAARGWAHQWMNP